MSTPFDKYEDSVKNYIQVVIGGTKQRVPILTQENCADWKRVMRAAVAGTDSEFILAGTMVAVVDDNGEVQPTATAEMYKVVFSDDELISTDEESLEEPQESTRRTSEEEKIQHQARMVLPRTQSKTYKAQQKATKAETGQDHETSQETEEKVLQSGQGS